MTTKMQQAATAELAAIAAQRDPSCKACRQLSVMSSALKCNRHRIVSMQAEMVLKAQASGYTGTDCMEAESFIGARPVVVG